MSGGEKGKIFHAYDVRGVYGTDLNESIMENIGRAAAVVLKAKTVLVGHDMRESSIPLQAALVKGLTEQGADVVDIGLCSSSLFYWATQKYPAGMMVTASHNPAKYNGCKVCRDGAQPVGELSGLKEIEQVATQAQFPVASRVGTVTKKEVFDEYIHFTTSYLEAGRKFRVVIDAANGMGGYTYGALLGRLPNVEIIPMYFELDGNFPNHEANPLKIETLTDLKARVVAEKADLGVAIDGDEDRIVFVDEKGEDLSSDLTTALLARQVLRKHPGATILYDIRQSRVTPEEITAAGGKAVMTRVGHSFIKMAMREHSGAWGGELSGHFYNREVQNAECTQLTFFQMLNLLTDEKKTLSELVAPLRARYAKISETNFTVPDPKGIIAALDKEYATHTDVTGVSRIDGVRIDMREWWFNVRASNTEPLLRLNLEAKTVEMRDQKFAEMTARIKALSATH